MTQIWLEVGKTYLNALFSPLFFLLIILVGWQYRRNLRLTGAAPHNTQSTAYIRTTLIAALAGILGGFVGSLLLLFFGIDLAGVGVGYLFLVALLLMLVHPRFICFAYAGGIISLSHLAFGFPRVDITQVMGLVAILHMIESLLILFTGHLDPVPVYARRESGKVVGGFNLQKFWPLPLVAFMSAGGYSSSLSLGQLWHFLKPDAHLIQALEGGLFPVLAVIGYGEVTTTSTPASRSKVSAAYLALYSLILLTLALISAKYPVLSILPALFGPVGHELVIAIGLRSEADNSPLYDHPRNGVRLLDVVKGSPADKAGLRSQDIILKVNNLEVESLVDIDNCIRFSPWGKLSLVISRGSQTMELRLLYKPRENMGIIPVPDGYGTNYISMRQSSRWFILLGYLRRLLR
ncbi:MAG: PDZ domain-containing protein [Chitinophagales bacterium]